MKKIVTFGELMLRLAPENYLRFVQSEKYEATFGGAEANVAVSLANYGMDVAFVTKLPAHEIGQAAVNSLRKFGVNTHSFAAAYDFRSIYAEFTQGIYRRLTDFVCGQFGYERRVQAVIRKRNGYVCFRAAKGRLILFALYKTKIVFRGKS